jgi:hypothetical protein
MIKSKSLVCTSCNIKFRTWKDYEDQDQGKGHGICKSCQDWQGSENLKRLKELNLQIRKVLAPENRKKFKEMSEQQQLDITMKIVNQGYFVLNKK